MIINATRLLILLCVALAVRANLYEFTIAANEQTCFSEHFKKDAQPVIEMQVYKLTKEHQNEELSDLTKAGVIDKRIGTGKVTLKVESESGIVYTAINKSDTSRSFKTKLEERVDMCFKNNDKYVAFVIFDLRTGVYSGDMSMIPTGEQTDELMSKIEGIRARLDNSLSLYRQMEQYEEKHLKTSNTVLSGILIVSQIMIAAIALVGWGITMLLEKSLKNKKVV